MAKIGIVIPAAGQGKRMRAGCNKQFLKLMGVPILVHTMRLFEDSSQVSEIVIVGAEGDLPEIEELVHSHSISKVRSICKGGEQRQDSVHAGVQALSPTIQRVVVHDGARPLLTLHAFEKFLEDTRDFSAAIMAIPVKDTIKQVDSAKQVLETLPRESLCAVQTPQIFEREILEEAHQRAFSAGYYGTDDASLLEWIGYPVHIVAGMQENIKVTTPEDLWLAERILAMRDPRTSNFAPREKGGLDIKVGIGYDVHALVDGRPLILGGVNIPHERGLLGHSDADVLIHAIMDAILGALALGDIGKHFPDNDPRYRGISSISLLEQIMNLIESQGYQVGNVDSIVVAERPKLAPFISAMRSNLAGVMKVEEACVSVKATTTERLGFAGREEGIAAQAIVCLERVGG